jgi:cytochrome c553
MRPFFYLCTAGLGIWISSNALAATQKNTTTNFAPLDYFNTSCARCHGDYGSFYGETFGKTLSDEKMLEVVKEMAEGPAQAPLEEKNLKVLVAYHTALRDGKPFLHVVSSTKSTTGWKLNGEATPNSTLRWNQQTIELKGHKWELELPANGPFLLQASKNGTSQDINLQPHIEEP